MAIRADDNWLFVTNYQCGQRVAIFDHARDGRAVGRGRRFPTDNYPWGVAVK